MDRELAGLRPEAKEVRRRLADGFLHVGRNADALRVAKRLYDEDPRYSDIQAIYSIARNRAKASAKPQPSRSSR